MARLASGMDAGKVVTLVLVSLFVLYVIGMYVVPVISPLLGGGDINLDALKDVEIKPLFGMVIGIAIVSLVFKVIYKGQISGRMIGFVILIGIGLYFLVTQFEFLELSMTSMQSMFLP